MGLITKLFLLIGLFVAVGWYLVKSPEGPATDDRRPITAPMEESIKEGLKKTGDELGRRALEGARREVDKWDAAAREAGRAAADTELVQDARESWGYMLHHTQRKVKPRLSGIRGGGLTPQGSPEPDGALPPTHQASQP